MSGAVVTSSGDHHRGFHQCPNVMRDRYASKIGVDGYGFVNYLMSWANTNATLSVRRMMSDLGVSQSKLERIQTSVLDHCGHFIAMTPGDRVSANRWHLDMENLWNENALHMAQSYAERMAAKGVSEINTPARKARRGVPKVDTPGVSEINTGGVLKPNTYKESVLKTSEKTGGEYNVTDNARATEPSGLQQGQTSSEPFTTTIASRLKDEGGADSPTASVAVLPPDGGDADASITDDEFTALFGNQSSAPEESETMTSSENVPPAVAALIPAPDDPHDPEETRALLVPALGGQKKLSDLMEETPPGLRYGQRRGWITQISPERAAEVIAEARITAGADNPWTYIIRALDREVGGQVQGGKSGPVTPVTPLPGAYLTPEEQAARMDAVPPVAEGETWHSRRTGRGYRIEEVTAQSVFVEGAGEYPFQKFHGLFIQEGSV